MVAVNISQNRSRKQTGDLRPRLGAAGKRIPEGRCRYRLRRHRLPIYRTRQLAQSVQELSALGDVSEGSIRTAAMSAFASVATLEGLQRS